MVKLLNKFVEWIYTEKFRFVMKKFVITIMWLDIFILMIPLTQF